MLKFNTDGSFEFVRGDNLRIPMAFTSASVATNLTGYAFKAQIREKPNTGVLVEFVVELTNLAGGLVAFTADDSVTKLIRVEEAFWDVQWTTPSGFVETIVGPAQVTIIKDITL